MRCPGQDTQYWKQDSVYEVPCPKCGQSVEFFKDDPARKCEHCGHRFANPHLDFGCAAYCPYAKQCIGDLPPEVAAQQDNLLKDRVAIAVKRRLGRDFKRIGQALRAARHAERLGKASGADMAPLLCAAYLHVLDDNGFSTQSQAILSELNVKLELAKKIEHLIDRFRHADTSSSLEIRLLHDAERLATWEAHQQMPGNPIEFQPTLLTQQANAFFQNN
jgi:hypothetical protein